MRDLYLGAFISKNAWLALPNERYLSSYMSMAIDNNIYVNTSLEFITNIGRSVQKTFGTQFELEFYDIQLGETMDAVDASTKFHLLVSLKPTLFYSTQVH